MNLSNFPLFLKALQLTIWSVFLTALTGIFGSIPLQALRKSISLKSYFSICFFSLFLMFLLKWTLLAFVFFFLSLLIGIYNFFLKKSPLSLFFNLTSASFVSISVAGTIFFTLFKTQSFKNTILTFFSNIQSQPNLTQKMTQFKSYLSNEITPQFLLSQTPSLVFIFSILALLFSLLLEKKIFQLFKITNKNTKPFCFLDFKLPQILIWLFIISFFISFYKKIPQPIQWGFLNFFTVLLFLYFLRGLVISLKLFDTFKIRKLWRIFFICIFTLKFPLSFSTLGIFDFWFDFEKKIKIYKKKKKEISKSNHKENKL